MQLTRKAYNSGAFREQKQAIKFQSADNQVIIFYSYFNIRNQPPSLILNSRIMSVFYRLGIKEYKPILTIHELNLRNDSFLLPEPIINNVWRLVKIYMQEVILRQRYQIMYLQD